MKNSAQTHTPFDIQTLQYFKELLLEKRRHAEEEANAIQNSIQNLREVDNADQSSAAHHMGDVGSEVEEENMNYQLLERHRTYIKQIDDALGRIENGTYGICQATGNPISKGRLEAVPHTRFSIAAKKNQSEGVES